MQVLEFGKALLFVAILLTGAIFGLSLLGIILKDRRFIVSARVGFYGLLILVGGSSACLVHGFITGEYNNTYIFRYSERALGTPFKVAGLWAGLDGSMLFWSLILCIYSAGTALQHRWSSRHPSGRRMDFCRRESEPGCRERRSPSRQRGPASICASRISGRQWLRHSRTGWGA